MILGIIIGIMILAIAWLFYVNKVGRMKIDLIKDEYFRVREVIDKLDVDWGKDIKNPESKLACIEDNLFVYVESKNMNCFQEKVSIGEILGELMKALGYEVSKGTLAVCRIEKKK